jgi:hypothetical protein
MAKVKPRVTDNTSLNVEGTIYRAGDVFEIERDYTAKQWIGAGFVTEVKSRRKTSGRPGALGAVGSGQPDGARPSVPRCRRRSGSATAGAR